MICDIKNCGQKSRYKYKKWKLCEDCYCEMNADE
jgi:hypothetical protein